MAQPGRRRGTIPEGSGRSAATRSALIAAAVEVLHSDGFGGASARAIAQQAGCNQALVFYHFGSVVDLLVAALDEVSTRRRDDYEALVASVDSPAALVDAAAAIFRQDLEAGHISVLVQMIAGSASTPGLGPAVAERIRPWKDFAATAVGDALGSGPLGQLVAPDQVAHAVVALYLGLEMLAHLDGDRQPALDLFDRVRPLLGLVSAQ